MEACEHFAADLFHIAGEYDEIDAACFECVGDCFIFGAVAGMCLRADMEVEDLFFFSPADSSGVGVVGDYDAGFGVEAAGVDIIDDGLHV